MTRSLILGGTSEASRLAQACADAGLAAVLSYAGRVDNPRAQPVETRIGGFGGAEGLAQWMRDNTITHLVDATHPFAAQISTNAVEAARLAGVPLMAFERKPWVGKTGDRWRSVPDMAGAVAALEGNARRVFLAIGRQNLDLFAAQPQHHYLLRLVDPPQDPQPLPDCKIVVDRGPFRYDDDLALLKGHAIDCVVAKNAGGEGARAKIDAARTLGLEVILIARPAVPERPVAHDLATVMAFLGHDADRGV
ncbi:MAG: cobalt-precorrin-6A reductase [Hyphomicrobiales bacterium]|nr:MAG: cobalt-precorrin-6A reductase [Hyphomicrobiales bacterium]